MGAFLIYVALPPACGLPRSIFETKEARLARSVTVVLCEAVLHS